MISIYILTPLIALFVAQGLKIILARRKSQATVRDLYVSGGMPSAHSAVAVSLSAIVGLEAGFESALFAIAGVTAFIVIYDAMNVRYSVGEQAKLLRELVAADKKLNQAVSAPRIVRGHTLNEVLAGSVLGVIVAISIFFLLNP